MIQYGAFDWLDAPIERVGAKFTPLPFAPVMEEFVVPHATTCSKRFAEPWGAAMATEVKLPRLGQGMESGTIVKWLKSEGDKVEKGEPLYELDTDKVTQEVEAEASGVLLKIAIAEGEVEVGKTIAVIGEQGEEVEVVRASPPATARPPEVADEPEEGSLRARVKMNASVGGAPRRGTWAQVAETGQPAGDDGGRIKASPLARRIARERGIDLAQSRAPAPMAASSRRTSSARGRVRRTVAGQHAGPSARGREVQQLSSMRKTIARRLTEAWQAPVFQLASPPT